MNLKDFAQLKGLMAMTAADNDGEALNSIRAANRLLARNGLTWDMVFARTVRVSDPVESGVADDYDDNQRLFERALSGSRGSFRTTLLSIQAQYETHGRLSERQWAVVREAAER
jgi:hypothetical protein